jgi:5-methylcytosine-specific restriction protein A
VEKAGYDTTDWVKSSNDPRGFKANPKYCYEWSFVEANQFIILNLWYANMKLVENQIVQFNNFRDDATANEGKHTWVKRAKGLDEALQLAVRDNLGIRVIINDGVMRAKGDPSSTPSRVTSRELDSIPWSIAEYDWKTGQNTLVRGILEGRFVDQFDFERAEKFEPTRRETRGLAYVRDPAVRRAVLRRANGRCEFCGSQGFEMVGGAIYLETHHIIPLSEGGPDAVENVTALCPNDHAKAHFSKTKDQIQLILQKKLQA